jgi:hypothetical protein
MNIVEQVVEKRLKLLFGEADLLRRGRASDFRDGPGEEG